MHLSTHCSIIRQDSIGQTDGVTPASRPVQAHLAGSGEGEPPPCTPAEQHVHPAMSAPCFSAYICRPPSVCAEQTSKICQQPADLMYLQQHCSWNVIHAIKAQPRRAGLAADDHAATHLQGVQKMLLVDPEASPSPVQEQPRPGWWEEGEWLEMWPRAQRLCLVGHHIGPRAPQC